MIGLGPGTNLPPPPVLGNLDPVKLEEIRRTIFVGNLEESVSSSICKNFYDILLLLCSRSYEVSVQFSSVQFSSVHLF